MADIVLFHHVQGLTPGVRALAAALAGDEHAVHTPDLYSGRTFGAMKEGFAYLQGLDEEAVRRQAEAAVAELPDSLIYAGMSWGVMHAQRLAQTRPGARGALFFDACVPVTGDWAFGAWPAGVSFQVHGMDQDEFFALEGDLDAAREIVSIVGPELGEVFTYPGDSHLFADNSLPSYRPDAAALAIERARAFLARV